MERRFDFYQGEVWKWIRSFSIISSFVAVITCVVCDYFISRELDWSFIVILSIISFWIFIPVTIGKKNAIRNFLIVLSLICMPFLFILSSILDKQLVVTLGGSLALIGCLSLWVIYCISLKFRGQPFLVLGFVFLLTIPLTTGIVWTCDFYMNRVTNQNTLLLQLTLSSLLAISCFITSFLKKVKL